MGTYHLQPGSYDPLNPTFFAHFGVQPSPTIGVCLLKTIIDRRNQG